jgi:amidohydrolase
MLKAGVLENPHVDASFGIHIFAAVPAGVLVYANGPMLSSCDVFEITVKGKGGHGSMPNDTVDPIMVGAHILTALESINSREIAPDSFGVLTVGCFQSGSKFNIIPDTAFMTGTIRTFDSEVREFIKKRLVELAEGTARAYRAEATVSFPTQICAVNTDKDVARIVGESVAAAVGAPRVIGNFKPIAGSEDFGYITSEVPSTFFGLGGCPTDYPAYPQHSPNIRFNEDAFPVGVAAYVSGAIGWLQSQAKEA